MIQFQFSCMRIIWLSVNNTDSWAPPPDFLVWNFGESRNLTPNKHPHRIQVHTKVIFHSDRHFFPFILILTMAVCAVYAQLLQSCPTLRDPMHRSLPGPWDSPGKNTGVDCHALLWEIFPTQGSHVSYVFCTGRRVLYHWHHPGSPSQRPVSSPPPKPFWKGRAFYFPTQC